MLSLDSNNRCDNCRYYCVCYWLLEGRVHDFGVSNDLFQMGNYYSKLVYVCEPRRVVKTRGSDVATLVFLLGTSKRWGFVSLVVAIQSTSICRAKLIQEVFLLPILRWNPWIAWARVSASGRKEKEAIVSRKMGSEKNKKKKYYVRKR